MHAPEEYKRRFPGLAPERRTYAAMLAAIDDGVGKIRETLSQHGLVENTLVIYLADNGATTEARAGLNQQPATAGDNSPFRGFKFSLFDGGMHVPGIMSWPGVIPAGQVSAQTVMTMDILPTICAAAGAPVTHKIDGRDILKPGLGERTIFWQNGQQSAALRGNFKLVLNGNPYGRTAEERKPLTGEDAAFLSDLSQDPGESRNLRRRHADVVDELSTAIHAWSQEVRE
jgi:arylsulfatase A-like enzyme